MTFNSRLAKLAERLAEKHQYNQLHPKAEVAFDAFTRGALHPTIIQAVRMEGAEKRRDEIYEGVKKLVGFVPGVEVHISEIEVKP